MIRLEALRVFVEVADRGTIREAADRLFRTPSALSMTLTQIESRIGCPLYETDRKSSLTQMGRFLYDQATALLRDYDRAMERIEAEAKGRSGRLRIASVPSVATMILPEFLRDFLKDRPDLTIDLVDTDSTDVLRLVETKEVDLGIAGIGPPVSGIACTPIFRDPVRLVCRSDSRLASLGPALDWADLEGEALILNEAIRALPAPDFQRLAREARFSVRNVASLLAMVAAGMGVTLLPALATAHLPDPLVARPLSDPACQRAVGIHWHEDRVASPLATLFRTSFATAARDRAVGLGVADDLPTSDEGTRSQS